MASDNAGLGIGQELQQMTKRTFAADHSTSQRKRQELKDYFAKNVWNDDEGFVCLSGKMCRGLLRGRPDDSFYEGLGQAVGSSYEVTKTGLMQDFACAPERAKSAI